MGTGLGKNSPVVLTLGKENYEALIARHGQWVRWRIATKCPCVKPNTMQPDIHCKKCYGLGFTYGYQKKEVVTATVMVIDNSGIIEIDNEFSSNPMLKCYDNKGVVYENAKKQDNFIILNAKNLPEKGVYVTVIMTKDVLKTLEKSECESVGNGYFRINELVVNKNNIDGLYHTAPCDIESIEEITDANGIIYNAKQLRQNCFYIEKQLDEQENELEITLPLTAKNIKYIEPFTFVLLNQNLSKSDAQVMQELNGDAILSFPYADDVSNDDVITVLSGTYTQKNVLARKDSQYDVLPAYFVDTVLECVGKQRNFEQGKDFLLLGTNYIKWICDDCPEEGEAYSVTYKVFPTYKVVKSIPQIRTSENQRMPKKAVVKLYDTYGEQRGINRQ